MVRPLKYSFTVFRSVTNDVTRGSYASVLDKNKVRCHDSNTKVIPGTTINSGKEDNANKQAVVLKVVMSVAQKVMGYKKLSI